MTQPAPRPRPRPLHVARSAQPAPTGDAGTASGDASEGLAGPVPGAPVGELRPARLLGRMNQRGFRLVMVLDAVLLYAVTVAVMLVRFGTSWPDYPTGLYLTSFTVTTLIFVASLYLGGLYEREPRLGAPPVLPRAAPQVLVAGGFIALLNLAATGIARELGFTTERALPFPILNLAVVIVVGSFFVAGNRQLASLVRTNREGFPRVLLVGDESERAAAEQNLRAEHARALVVGETDDPGGVPRLVADTDATDVLLLSRNWLDALYPDTIGRLEVVGTTVLVRVTARETLLGIDRLREVGGMPFVLVRPHAIPASRARFKRLFDLAVLHLAMPVWALMLAFIAVYQGFAVGRPLLYIQERVGRGGVRFRMVKFRTMSTDAEDDGLGPRLASPDDPRIIPACRWVRASRMDELPQLYNVLRGEMSLVGPRPERPELVAELAATIPGYDRRHEVPPGMTGLAQIHGRYHTGAEHKLGYDLQYLVNWSPVLDLEILARTVWVVLTRRL